MITLLFIFSLWSGMQMRVCWSKGNPTLPVRLLLLWHSLIQRPLFLQGSMCFMMVSLSPSRDVAHFLILYLAISSFPLSVPLFSFLLSPPFLKYTFLPVLPVLWLPVWWSQLCCMGLLQSQLELSVSGMSQPLSSSHRGWLCSLPAAKILAPNVFPFLEAAREFYIPHIFCSDVLMRLWPHLWSYSQPSAGNTLESVHTSSGQSWQSKLYDGILTGEKSWI